MAAQYYNELLRFCSLTVKDPDAARDVVQDAYQRFLAAQAGGTAIPQPRAFLKQVARRLLVDRHRFERVRDHLDIDGLAETDEPAAPRHLQPEEVLASMQVIRAYVAAIEALPPRCREAFILHVFDEMTHAEIARKMEISCSMVEKHIVRAMVACKICERELARQDRPGP
ncbi:sigma-70 family RNA polymerase sigma factor [Achromobacter aloeverae]